MKNVIVFGSGQTGNMAASILSEQGYEVLGFVDDAPDAPASSYGRAILGTRDILLDRSSYDAVCVGVGTIKSRRAIVGWLKENDIKTVSAIHSSAVIDADAQLGDNLIIGAGSVFYVNPVIGEGCFVGPSVTVSHDTVVGPFCLLSVGSVIGARCDLATGVLIGSGATLMPPGFRVDARLNIGQGAIVGVGSTVIRDVDDNTTVVGTPAKPIPAR
ncbi:acetyltransferase [Octadecabacter sp. G9-8]|uniref:Acetyltransferase n=1 Tax=Octadecabacter dasysiphoniae TaxID=2909341 RepID=A0ABS9CV56_9RHOB|nr:acetyltransferase [Octadecabacter dasysiphoniae]MCF2870947.1 acetyltransferase [Octadecabacter dasysiphoniae]